MSEQSHRLSQGGRIDRNKPLSFTFEGRTLQGYAGDTLASALLANGMSLVGRSFKYRRPRGIVGSGAEEPNAIVQIGSGASTLPGQRATQVALYEGLSARVNKGWPSLQTDIAAGFLGVFHRVFSAGFYYKTFMGPRGFWERYERFIRSAAGLGQAPTLADPDHYSHTNVHCDVLVAGAGPAGLLSALSAMRAGARVIIADEQEEFGGALLHTSETLNGQPASEWVADVVAQLAASPRVTLLPRSTVFGYYDDNFLAIAQRCTDHLGEHAVGQTRQRMWRVRAGEAILAQGAFERPLVFGNNDRPGVMTASAVSTYVNRYAVAPGRRAVLFTNNDSAYHTALDLHRAGIDVAAVVDVRSEGAGEVGQRVGALGIEILHGQVVVDVQGRQRVRAAQVMRLRADGKSVAGGRVIECDLIACSGGWSPAVHLHSHAGGRNVWDESRACFVPGTRVQANVSIGAGNGTFAMGDVLREAALVGREVAARAGFSGGHSEVPVTQPLIENPLQPLWRVPGEQDAERGPKQFLDFQNDTSVADVRLAVREGYRNVEHVKRYTALGFGTDQGKLGNINGMAVLAECLGEPIANIGTTTFRPAYTPVTFGTVAGEDVGPLFDPARKTAMHSWHEAAGATFEVVGQWLRPWYYPKAGEDMPSAVARECAATRRSLGIMDASTLGKIDVHGPDAVEFLERMYTHNIGAMKVGRCAYGIMLGEDGMVMDDGVMARVAEDRFYLTTTTGGAANVMSWLERWLQTEWPWMKVHMTSLTDHWSTIALVGPHSRQLLQRLDSDIDFAAEVFGFMCHRTGHLEQFEVNVFRVSFSGELAFELNVHSDYALALWKVLMEAGRAFDITPYGTESLHVLRAEKGFVIVGQDTDGSVTPQDLGMHWMLSKDKDYIGRRSTQRSDSTRKDRKQLVGLLSVDGETVLCEGAQVVEGSVSQVVPVPMSGHVTSSYHSACLGHPIALALVAGGRARKGQTVQVASHDGSVVPATVVSPVFYDPKGEKQRV